MRQLLRAWDHETNFEHEAAAGWSSGTATASISGSTLNVAVREHFGPWRAVALTAEAWDHQYITERRKAGRQDATINRERAVVLAAFKLAVARKRFTAWHVPMLSRLPERNVRRAFFERDELEAVVAHLPAYLQDAARFSYLSGWRKRDVARLTLGAVDTRAMTITRSTAHDRTRRVEPCTPAPLSATG